MSRSLPPDEKHHYVSVMQHTLHAVRSAGPAIEFCAECALADEMSVQTLLDDWSEGQPVSATVAVAPEPVWWHLGNSTESRNLLSDDDVRRFAARLPHRLPSPFEVIGCNAADGMPVTPEGDSRWMLGVTPGDALAGAAAGAIECGISTAALGSATLACVAAATTMAQLDDAGAIRLWAIGGKESYVFTVGVHGVAAIGRCAIGFETLFAAVQQVFGLNSRNEAARLLFADQPPDPAAAETLIATVAPQLDSVLAASAHSGPVRFACAGLTGKETWFGREVARTLGLPYWTPQPDRYLEHLRMTLAHPLDALPSLNLLGTLHLAATHAHGNAAWHPSWGSISRGAVRSDHTSEFRAPVASVFPRVAVPPSSAPGASVPSPSPQEARIPDLPTAPPAPVLPPRTPAVSADVAAAAIEADGGLNAKSPHLTAPTSAPAPKPQGPSPDPVSPLTHLPALASAHANTPPPNLESKSEAHPKPVAPAVPTAVQTPERGSPSAQPVAVPRGPRLETNGATHAKSLSVTAPTPALSPNARSPSTPTVPRISPAAARRSVPLPPSRSPALPPRQAPATGGRDELPPPPAANVEPPTTPREPVVIVLRKRGYWPHAAIVAVLLGAGVAAKFYVDADAIKTAAAREKRVAEDATEKATVEVAAAVQQVRLAAEQAARADQRSREVAAATTKEVERARADVEAARLNALSQARRDAEEQARQLVARELAAARAATAPGVLKIASAPAGAEVSIDDRPAQRAPASIEGLAPGRHAVKVTLEGHVPMELGATITGSKITDLGVIKLARATGAVDITSEPGGIDYSIRALNTPADAAPLRRGQTPVQLDELPTGEYAVQFTRAGWPDRTERVTVGLGATARVATRFQGGTVTINSSPTGATVIEGGVLLGKTPLTLGDVPPRDVTYELSAPGFEPLKVRGTVVSGRELELNSTLLDLDRLAQVEEVRTPPRPYLTTPLDFGRVSRSTPPYITVSFIVLRNGSVEDVKVVEPVDKKIVQRSIEAIAKWKYYPGVSHAGYPVNVRMSIPIKVARG